jgi:3-oxoacyl-[acyl-carrier protein] reductase
MTDGDKNGNMTSLTDISGHVAIVTGGTQGIGLAAAQKFAAEGAKVAITGRSADHGQAALDALKPYTDDVIFLQGDATSGADVAAAIALVDAKWGRIDILVNSAGGFLKSPRIDEIDEEGWRQGIEWNLTAKFLSVRAAVPIMKRAQYGRIVNVSSVAGRSGVVAAPLDYSAAKAGVVGFTRRLAVELAPVGITANVVAPGTTQTPRLSRLSHRRMEEVIARIPIGRLGLPEEIALGIWYLCTPGAGYTTGAVLDMNGGVWTGA